MLKTLKLNKFNGKLIGAALFLNAELIAPYVTSEDTYINVELEESSAGILIRPLKAVEIQKSGGNS